MSSRPSDFETALRYAKLWTSYEGVADVISSGEVIIVMTTCNPAAITAPIPSSFRGYPVSYCQQTNI